MAGSLDWTDGCGGETENNNSPSERQTIPQTMMNETVSQTD
jgi:hypothetical protein